MTIETETAINRLKMNNIIQLKYEAAKTINEITTNKVQRKYYTTHESRQGHRSQT